MSPAKTWWLRIIIIFVAQFFVPCIASAVWHGRVALSLPISIVVAFLESGVRFAIWMLVMLVLTLVSSGPEHGWSGAAYAVTKLAKPFWCAVLGAISFSAYRIQDSHLSGHETRAILDIIFQLSIADHIAVCGLWTTMWISIFVPVAITGMLVFAASYNTLTWIYVNIPIVREIM